MAPAARRTCRVPGCSSGEGDQPYTTMEGIMTQENIMEDLKLHLAMVHRENQGREIEIEKPETHPDKYPRPEIMDPATDTE